MTGFLVRGKRHGRCPLGDRSGDWSDISTSQGTPNSEPTPKVGEKRKDAPYTFQKETLPANTSILGSQSP